MNFKGFILFALVITMVSCGIKGPPQPTHSKKNQTWIQEHLEEENEQIKKK